MSRSVLYASNGGNNSGGIISQNYFSVFKISSLADIVQTAAQAYAFAKLDIHQTHWALETLLVFHYILIVQRKKFLHLRKVAFGFPRESLQKKNTDEDLSF